MNVEGFFHTVKWTGNYHGRIGTCDSFGGEEANSVSASKLISRVVKVTIPGQPIYLVGELHLQSIPDLAVVIGDLRDMEKHVVVELYDEKHINPIATMPSWSIARLTLDSPEAHHVDEVSWGVTESINEDIIDYVEGLPSFVPVSIFPHSAKAIPNCFKLVASHPSWTLFTEKTSCVTTPKLIGYLS